MAIEPYLNDAMKMMGFAAPLITREMGRDQCIQALQHFSNGMEKLLKHALRKINPLFILRSPDFKHSAMLYNEQFVPNYSGPEVEKRPDQDVISCRPSLSRLKVFSPAANKHSQLLHTVINWRDVLAHRPSCELDIDAVKRMLLKDAFCVVRDFALEMGITPEHFFRSQTYELETISREFADADRVSEYMMTLLEEHRRIWELRESDAPFIAKAQSLTKIDAEHYDAHFSNDVVECPACGQEAVVRIEPDYDYSDGKGYISGAYPERLTCHFCDLELVTYDEFNFVNLDELLTARYLDGQ